MNTLGTYSTYINSPMYNGKLQHDMWGVEVDNFPLHDWDTLRQNIKTIWSTRNSLLVAPTPTASTSQILVILSVLNR